jgi:hypothetical protein
MPRLRTRIIPRPGGSVVDLTPPTPPSPQSLASSATTASLTWTHTGAPAGTTYALTVVDDAGASVSPSSGSGLGAYVIPVTTGKAYTARLRATGTDGQIAQSSALVYVATADLSAPTPPSPQSLASSATTASLTWTHSTAPVGTTYTLAVVDETGASVSPSSGSGLGAYVIPVTAGKAYTARLRATGPDGQISQSSALVYVAPSATIAGAWTQIGQVNFVGATAQTFTTTGDKTVTLADSSTVTVNVSMSVGSVTTGTAGSDATRGLIADVPGAVASTAYRLRTAVPVSPSISSTDDLLVSIRWRANMATGTGQRAVVGVTVASGSEASTEFSGGVLQNTATNAVKWQCRKTATVADVAASVDTGWRDGTTRIQTDVRVVGKARTLFATATSRNVDSGTATYTSDIGGDSSGPNAGLEAPLFSGSTVYVQLYSWNGGASGAACSTAIERITVYSRASTRVP